MAWHRPGDQPLSEPMMASLLTNICITRPQWVNYTNLYSACIVMMWFALSCLHMENRMQCIRLLLIADLLEWQCSKKYPRIFICVFWCSLLASYSARETDCVCQWLNAINSDLQGMAVLLILRPRPFKFQDYNIKLYFTRSRSLYPLPASYMGHYVIEM